MDALVAPGRRERKRQETRDTLRRAALDLCLQRGYDRLTVEAITEAADVSVRTFFNYFGSKEDALLGLDLERASELTGTLATRVEGEDPIVRLRAAVLQMAESFTDREPIWHDRLEVLRRNPQLWPPMVARFAAFEETLTKAIASRTGHDSERDLYPGVVAAALVGAIRVAVAHWRSSTDGSSLPHLVDRAFDVLAEGLSPDRERA